MLRWAALFLIIALVAGIFGMGFIAGVSVKIAWIVFVIFLVLFLVALVSGRRTAI